MTDTTSRTLVLAPTAGTGDSTDNEAERRLRDQLVRGREQVHFWEPPRTNQLDPPGRPLGRPSVDTNSLSRSLTVELDGDRVVVSDSVGAAYGEGPSFAEAMQHWFEAAREHYEELAREEPRLHPRMQAQLRFLRQIFG